GGPLADTGGGIATVYGLYGSYPLVRSDTGDLTVSTNLDYKRMSDTTQTVSSRVRTAKTLGFQLGGYRRGSLLGLPNALQFEMGLTGGNLQDDIDFKNLTTRGNYAKTMQMVRLTQALRQDVYLDLSLNAQQASHDLDGSEKMVLGGPNAVRAYSNEVPSADSGYLASANLSVAVPKVKGLTAQVFYDYAQGKLQKFSSRDSTVILAGYGFGLNYTVSGHAVANLSYAMRTGREDLRGQNKAMVWASAVVRF
ncbi:MAG TPA: ShlB/FhaC/HecB family hemolysin secretion/activation protein, partial [Trinickia sp.]|nr:ShlB/FhaC/HecB family hemolysin secretion/activation protein [Trinickia sp.]